MATLASLRADTVDYIRFRLGDGMVDVELDPEHYDNCIDKSVQRFRQRSQNAYESSYVFLSVVKEQQEYTLPDEIEEVRQAFRRSVGSGSSDTGTQFEPFEAAFQNTYFPETYQMQSHQDTLTLPCVENHTDNHHADNLSHIMDVI